jgi:hypothetical protein
MLPLESPLSTRSRLSGGTARRLAEQAIIGLTLLEKGTADGGL